MVIFVVLLTNLGSIHKTYSKIVRIKGQKFQNLMESHPVPVQALATYALRCPAVRTRDGKQPRSRSSIWWRGMQDYRCACKHFDLQCPQFLKPHPHITLRWYQLLEPEVGELYRIEMELRCTLDYLSMKIWWARLHFVEVRWTKREPPLQICPCIDSLHVLGIHLFAWSHDSTYLINGAVEIRVTKMQPLSICKLESLNDSMIREHSKVVSSKVVACIVTHTQIEQL